jgi:NAD(P)-dependent dehydrogenase (short-subunit alcohol dehydrogenase family)
MEHEGMPTATEPLPSFRLQGKLALLTGASEGIGQRLAVAFAQAGAKTALVSREPSRLAATVQRIQALGAQTRRYQADVRSLVDMQQLVAQVIAAQGPVSVLVNAAGVPLTKPAFEVTEAEWDLVMDTGLKGTFFACLAIGKHMAQQGYGKIINLSSTYAQSVGLGKSVYAISKAGVSHLTRALALEWAPLGIRVNAIAPTLTVTPTRQGVMDDPQRMASILSRIPMGRYAQPSDLVGAAIFLATEASDFVTGQTLYVDGGWNAGG